MKNGKKKIQEVYSITTQYKNGKMEGDFYLKSTGIRVPKEKVQSKETKSGRIFFTFIPA